MKKKAVKPQQYGPDAASESGPAPIRAAQKPSRPGAEVRRTPPSRIEGELEIGRTDNYEVVMNLPADFQRPGHIVFSPDQARALAQLLNKHAKKADAEYRRHFPLRELR